MAAKNFKQDFTQSNPGLHRLYVEYAIGDLATIDRCIELVDSRSHTSLSGVMVALFEQRKLLVEEEAAFAEADRLLKISLGIIKGEKFEEPVEEVEDAPKKKSSLPVEGICKHCNVAIQKQGESWITVADPNSEFAGYCWIDDDRHDVSTQIHELAT